jgi:hypothetical protein
MIANPIEEAIRNALNDRRIFWMPQELINKADFGTLKDALSKLDTSLAFQVISQSKDTVEERIKTEHDRNRKWHLEDARRLLVGLENHIAQDPSFVRNLLDQLESFGPVICNLPNMEDFGKIIEGHSRSIAEQFLLYKIQKEKDLRRRQALVALLEIVKKLYDRRVEPLEIAFFVRKINSLGVIVEVLK